MSVSRCSKACSTAWASATVRLFLAAMTLRAQSAACSADADGGDLGEEPVCAARPIGRERGCGGR